MKKHLIAAAVAAAVAAPAMAQNVTIFGTLDAGVANFSNVNTNADDFTGFVDGAITSSIWGLRGSEDLGGGLRAVFELTSDAQTNNGAQHQTGVFRRAAYAGLAGGFGEITFGVRTNPLIAANGALMPLGGNSVATNTASALGYADFFTRNAVTYTSPNLNGLVLQAQAGMANTAQEDTNAGRVFAGSITYAMGPLTFRGAMQDRKVGTAGYAQANASTSGKNTTLLGIMYRSGPLALAASTHTNEIDGAVFAANGLNLAAARQYRVTSIGGSYQLTPAWQLGANYVSGEGSNLTNAQGRYALSKRTTAWVQYTSADNGGTIAFSAIGGNTGTENVGLYSGRVAGAATASVTGFAPANTKASTVGAGLIHSF